MRSGTDGAPPSFHVPTGRLTAALAAEAAAEAAQQAADEAEAAAAEAAAAGGVAASNRAAKAAAQKAAAAVEEALELAQAAGSVLTIVTPNERFIVDKLADQLGVPLLVSGNCPCCGLYGTSDDRCIESRSGTMWRCAVVGCNLAAA